MNLEKARETYEHDPQYHHLVDMLIHQIEALELAPSEIREAAMFACLIIEERSTHPLVMINFAEVEKQCIAKCVSEGTACKECYVAIGPSEDGLCKRCRVTKAADTTQEAKSS